ncbi:hypothetical protein E2C01_027250 [Portunus trituberculatus]|uniref:Uncharacterized protein n=1 Tax=Portunus trituberculatus TaxID=210409 RepID=A0A5B7ELF9_PORTR|nr:hypothetical protein [Portunus trituberculatus]
MNFSTTLLQQVGKKIFQCRDDGSCTVTVQNEAQAEAMSKLIRIGSRPFEDCAESIKETLEAQDLPQPPNLQLNNHPPTPQLPAPHCPISTSSLSSPIPLSNSSIMSLPSHLLPVYLSRDHQNPSESVTPHKRMQITHPTQASNHSL